MHIVTQSIPDQSRAHRPTPVTNRRPQSSHNEGNSTPRSERRFSNGTTIEDGGFSSDTGSEGDIYESFLEDSILDSKHDCFRECCNRVTVNVSGLKFETQLRTLNRLPHTLLGNPKKREKFWDEKRKEYFFDRHRPSFPAILFYYQSGGRLIRPLEVHLDIFLEELRFFELGKQCIDAFKQSEGYIMEKPPMLPKNQYLRKIWELFENPGSSWGARVVAIVSVSFILASIVTFCVETLPEYKGTGCMNVTLPRADNESEIVVRSVPNYRSPLFIVETVCIMWFILELILRAISCPSKKLFIKDVINWIDLAAIMPYFVVIIVFLITDECGGKKSGILSVLRVLRVTRVLKLSKHSEGLKILGKTMTASAKELVMFVLFLGIGVLIFSGAIFSVERSHPGSHFSSIPDAFWWAIVSMTTVGYGDMYPISPLGKLIGSFTVISGILAVALPVPVIVTNFNNFYTAATGRGNYL